MRSRFPKRVYTEKEVEKARKLVQSGHKHRLVIKGNPRFKERVRESLRHVKVAGYYSFLRTYIKQIAEIDGFSQLRESEASIWANTQVLENPVEAAGFFVQKASQMKEFLEGKVHYGGEAEARSVEKNIEFLKNLESRSKDKAVKDSCERTLRKWADSTFVF